MGEKNTVCSTSTFLLLGTKYTDPYYVHEISCNQLMNVEYNNVKKEIKRIQDKMNDLYAIEAKMYIWDIFLCVLFFCPEDDDRVCH